VKANASLLGHLALLDELSFDHNKVKGNNIKNRMFFSDDLKELWKLSQTESQKLN